jgi:hypothetical protein
LGGPVATSEKPATRPAHSSTAFQSPNRPESFQPAPAAGYRHFLLFNRALGVRTLSISASRAACDDEKGHDDRFFRTRSAAAIDSRFVEMG